MNQWMMSSSVLQQRWMCTSFERKNRHHFKKKDKKRFQAQTIERFFEGSIDLRIHLTRLMLRCTRYFWDRIRFCFLVQGFCRLSLQTAFSGYLQGRSWELNTRDTLEGEQYHNHSYETKMCVVVGFGRLICRCHSNNLRESQLKLKRINTDWYLECASFCEETMNSFSCHNMYVFK